MFTNQVIIISVVDVISKNHQTIIAIMSCKFFVIHLVVSFSFTCCHYIVIDDFED